jgi:tetratricopeptide (TPR) repeat protein
VRGFTAALSLQKCPCDKILSDRCMAYYYLDRYDDALTDINAAFHIDTAGDHAAMNHYRRGLVLEQLRQWPKAMDDFRLAIALRPTYANPHWRLARQFLIDFEWPQALEHARAAVDLCAEMQDDPIPEGALSDWRRLLTDCERDAK